MENKFANGEAVMDKITGYVGRITAVAVYYDRDLTQYLVEGMDRTGRPIAEWVDEQRLARAELAHTE